MLSAETWKRWPPMRSAPISCSFTASGTARTAWGPASTAQRLSESFKRTIESAAISRVHTLGIRHVANEAHEHPASLGWMDADGQLDRELRAVGAHGGHLDAPPDDAAGAGDEIACESGTVRLAQAKRDDHVGQRSTQCL